VQTFELIPLRHLNVAGPIDEPLIRALLHDAPERRRVPVGRIRLSPRLRACGEDVALRERLPRGPPWGLEPARTNVLLLERSDGSLR
jgi:hypothetical protein